MNLAILFGGASFEHEISIVSAITLREKLPNFDLTFIFCDQEHAFHFIYDSEMRATSFSSGLYKKMPKLTPVHGGFARKKLFGSETLNMPVLNLIHGADGEDGTIAALLDFYGIDYIGPRAVASVLSFDKQLTKWLAADRGIKTVDYTMLHKGAPREAATPLPFIIKPTRLGSSIGVSVVRETEELDYALDVAFEFDETVLIEPFIEGVKEYNLAGYKGANGIVFSMIEEPQKQAFLDFEKKYLDFSRTQKVGAAELDDTTESALKAAFTALYDDLFEGALIRCDFFVIDGEVHLNEINPVPGSMANYLFDDFPAALHDLASHLPTRQRAGVDYKYIHSISRAKGK